MDVESVRSGRSERSDRSYRSHRSRPAGGNGYSNSSNFRQQPQPLGNPYMAPMMSGAHQAYFSSAGPMSPPQVQHLQSAGGWDPSPPPLPPQHNQMPQHSGPGTVSIPVESERIEVQILPQDENWGETTTALTGATSETGVSMENMSKIQKEMEDSAGFDCARTMGIAVSLCLGLVAFMSPIVMVVLPKLSFLNWTANECTPACEGQLISLAFKLLILILGTWALFFRRNNVSMPRVFIFRALVLFLVFVVTFAFWLFYGVRVLEKKVTDYYSIVLFAVSLADTLLFIHYLAIILLELRYLQSRFSIKVVRSPDGESHVYRVGDMSIQRAAVVVLQSYMTDFEVYNPYLANAPHRRSHVPNHRSSGTADPRGSGKYKFYDVDGSGGNASGGPANGGPRTTPARSVRSASSRGTRSGGASERFYEEVEYEKRVRKRRARFMVAVEEAFTHVKRASEESGPAKPMDPYEAAQAVFPTLLKPLQKYLRITRQQPRYSMEMIIDHLALCLSHDMSPRAFAERYLAQGAVIEDAKGFQGRQTWTILSDMLLSRGLRDGIVFQLRQGEVSLLCTVRRLPFFSITEEILDPKNNRFVLKLNSETSV